MGFTGLPLDTNGFSFNMNTFYLDPKEYSKIYSEINQIYEIQYKNKAIASHVSYGIDGIAYIYWFENHGYNDYNIFQRVLDNH